MHGTSNATISLSSDFSEANFGSGVVADPFDSAALHLAITDCDCSTNYNDQLSVTANDSSHVDVTATGNHLLTASAGTVGVLSCLDRRPRPDIRSTWNSTTTVSP
jgi:hypothetical protein